MKRTSYDQLALRAKESLVLVTTGYSALGYETPEAVGSRIDRLARMLMSKAASTQRELLVVSGATIDGGICNITYQTIATLRSQLSGSERSRLATVGLVSATAEREKVPFHPVDLLCVVDPSAPGSWEVRSPKGHALTVDVAIQAKWGMIAAFRGGAVTATEIAEGIVRGASCVVYQGDNFQPRRDNVRQKIASLTAEGTSPVDAQIKVDGQVNAVRELRGIYAKGRRVADDPDDVEPLAAMVTRSHTERKPRWLTALRALTKRAG